MFGSYLEGDRQECQEPLGRRGHLESKRRSPPCITSSRKPALKPSHTWQCVAPQLSHVSVYFCSDTASPLWAVCPHLPLPLSSLSFPHPVLTRL